MHRLILSAILPAILLAGCSTYQLTLGLQRVSVDIDETTILSGGGAPGGAKIVVIDVSGLLANQDAGFLGLASSNPVAWLTESLDRAARDKAVKAVILRIDSPGGTVTASDMMYRELLRFRARTGKPVLALQDSMAASGGYYVSCGADYIMAHPTTVTGSIGVIMKILNVEEGLGRIGVEVRSITSGTNKSMGSPTAPMTWSQEELFQGIVDEFYEGFLTVVRTSRPGISEEDLARVTDGRILTGREAHRAGLVDELGDIHDAFSRARDLAGLEKAQLVKYHRRGAAGSSLYSVDSMGDVDISLIRVNLGLASLSMPGGFYYLWVP